MMRITRDELELYADMPMPGERADAYRAYLEYRSVSSVARVAEKLGYPLSRVRGWRKRFYWDERAALHLEVLGRISKRALASRLAMSVLEALTGLESVMKDAESPPRERVNAAVHILKLAGVYPEPRVQVSSAGGSGSSEDAMTRNVLAIQQMALAALAGRVETSDGGGDAP